MQPPKTARPAIARGDEPTLMNCELLGGGLDMTNTLKGDEPQADDAGQSDFEYFSARPHARIRNRLPFDGEFSAAILDEGGLDCFVHAIVERDAAGRPTRRARWLLFCQGGRA
jgi:hypothetical protein